ncbi:hypothetical protein CB1_000726100 [Camelus ferus]|nr:hypothetical protein CB1_000726100 [Camelus ferus]
MAVSGEVHGAREVCLDVSGGVPGATICTQDSGSVHHDGVSPRERVPRAKMLLRDLVLRRGCCWPSLLLHCALHPLWGFVQVVELGMWTDFVRWPLVGVCKKELSICEDYLVMESSP